MQCSRQTGGAECSARTKETGGSWGWATGIKGRFLHSCSRQQKKWATQSTKSPRSSEVSPSHRLRFPLLSPSVSCPPWVWKEKQVAGAVPKCHRLKLKGTPVADKHVLPNLRSMPCQSSPSLSHVSMSISRDRTPVTEENLRVL